MTRPLATYRLQLTPSFGFEAARARLGYLERLGVDCLYLSPVFEARPGSEHGYDVADPTRLRGELGGEEAFRSLAEEARSRGFSILLDIVPNHMAAHHGNPWWRETLSRGRRSAGASLFDIDWEAGDGRVVLPALGAPLEEVLARGELRVEREAEGGASLVYYEKRFPLSAETAAGAESAAAADLLERQHYALCHWRASAERRNYRRFFDIDDLVALRAEDPEVFRRTHGLILSLWGEGIVDGLRIDHIDGLARPRAYLDRLREAMKAARPGASPWVVVEKILGHDERLSGEWACEGTTGYETLNEISRLFVTPEALAALRDDASGRGAASQDFRALVRESKREILDRLFAGELRSLARSLAGLAEGVSEEEARSALRETIAWLDVYRTYAADIHPIRDEDRARLERAIAGAHAEGGGGGVNGAFEAIRRAMCGQTARSEALQWFVERFEQLCGPAMAKGLEDTALYRDAALTGLNEVGGEPLVTDHPPTAFHERVRTGMVGLGGSLTALSTHDSKRGEETRASILALASDPDGWIETLDRLERSLARMRVETEDGPAPEGAHERILLEAYFGLLPLEGEAGEDVGERLAAYAVKAGREAKERTRWRRVDEAYERGVASFVRALTEGEEGAEARRALLARRDALARWSGAISLVQTAVRLTAPGVADTYQGSEWENRSVVDPDNRRAVDFEAMEAGLGRGAGDGAAWGDWRRAETKIRLVARLHGVRRACARVFREGSYEGLETSARESVMAFARRAEEACVVLCGACARRGLDVSEVEVERPMGADRWRDALTGERFGCAGERIRLEGAWSALPVRVLVAWGE